MATIAYVLAILQNIISKDCLMVEEEHPNDVFLVLNIFQNTVERLVIINYFLITSKVLTGKSQTETLLY